MAQTNKEYNHLTNLELSIQISLSGLSFCVLNPDTKTIIELKSQVFSIKKTPTELLDAVIHLFNTEEILNQNFSSINIIHVNDWSTLVPKALFKEDYLADYLKFNTKILKTDFITFDEIITNESINIYVPFTNINNYIFDKYGSFTYKHFSTILIEQLLVKEKHSSDTKVYVNIDTNNFEIIAIKEGGLLLYNTFEYHTKEDYIYYLLFTLEQLQLNPETLQLVLLVLINKEDDVYNITNKYIRNVSFGNRMDTYNFTKTPTTNYSYFTLLKSL
jgi:hypothetical protein